MQVRNRAVYSQTVVLYLCDHKRRKVKTVGGGGGGRGGGGGGAGEGGRGNYKV